MSNNPSGNFQRLLRSLRRSNYAFYQRVSGEYFRLRSVHATRLEAHSALWAVIAERKKEYESRAEIANSIILLRIGEAKKATDTQGRSLPLLSNISDGFLSAFGHRKLSIAFAFQPPAQARIPGSKAASPYPL